MDDRLQYIITASKNAIINAVINTYDYLDDILVFKEYEINPDDDLITQTKMFILRYRRIIGILLLIILLYMGFKCDFVQSRGKGENADRNENRKENIQKGGDDYNFKGMGFWNGPGGQQAKADSNLTDAAKQKKKDDNAEYKKLSHLDRKKLKYSRKAKEAFSKSSAGKKIKEIKDMRVAGKSRFAIAGNMAYQAGAFVGDKAKEFAGWLYQILFAIAISIAICMVVLPSISFFIVGIICFFLLKSKMSTFKSL